MGMVKMFDRLRRIFDRNKGAKPVNSDFMRPKEEPVKQASVVSSDLKGPLPAVIPDKPPVIFLPSVTASTAPAAMPAEEVEPAEPTPLPPGVDPEQVVVVKHEEKKASGERFRYVDKPLKPLSSEGGKAEFFKYSDKKGEEVIKYKAAQPKPRAAIEGREKPVAEVFKYKPVRIEIKS